MEAHANDSLPLLSTAVQRGRTCIVCAADNGPDMNPTNRVNEVHLCNLWFDSCADMITFTSYAAGQSAYNMIEHAWSPLSNCLTSVKLPATLPEEDKPPNKQVLEKEGREKKEKRMSDNAADILAKYWDFCSYDGHAVIPFTVPSTTSQTYNEHEDILKFVTAPLRDFKASAKLRAHRKNFRFYANNTIHHENEFVLMKCQFFNPPGLECDHCKKNCCANLGILKKNSRDSFWNLTRMRVIQDISLRSWKCQICLSYQKDNALNWENAKFAQTGNLSQLPNRLGIVKCCTRKRKERTWLRGRRSIPAITTSKGMYVVKFVSPNTCYINTRKR